MNGSGPRRAAVLGSPVGHSLSPVLHRTAYAALGLPWSYDAVDCDEAGLSGFLAGLDDSWAGLSLTMPLKRAVLPLLDTVSELALSVGAVNTVLLDGGRRAGDNTDVGGMLDALREIGVVSARSAAVLGGGATASSALAVLRSLGVDEVAVVVRDPARTGELRSAARRVDCAVRVHTFGDLPCLLPVDLAISTVPAVAADHVAEIVARGTGAVLDVIYDPWPTPLAVAVHRAGGRVAGGFAMLLHQAARQVELMTGSSHVPVEAMRDAGEWALAQRATAPRRMPFGAK